MAEHLVFKRIASPQPVADYIYNVLARHLTAGRSVVWLVAGGSAMDVAVLVAKQLSTLDNLAKLTVTLTDERWGEPGHQDSNWRQLGEKGFKLSGAQLAPVLTGKNLAQSAADYGQFLTTAIKHSDYSLALAGMGPDGHIFGILPNSPASASDQPVIGYKWTDYARLTPTISLLKQLDEVVVYATGEPKWPQIDKLKDSIPAAQQPAQLLKQLPKVIFFNDHRGEIG